MNMVPQKKRYGLEWMDIHKDQHVEAMLFMYREYSAQSLAESGYILGIPFDVWLATAFIIDLDEKKRVGFVSIHGENKSVETIHVLARARRQGAALGALRLLHRYLPYTLKLKGPLSREGQALLAASGLEEIGPSPEEKSAADVIREDRAKYREALRIICKHRNGRPGLCRKCIPHLVEGVIGYYRGSIPPLRKVQAFTKTPTGVLTEEGIIKTTAH